MSIFLNLSLIDIAPIKDYTSVLWLSIDYIPKENGFPQKEELEKLEAFEDKIVKIFREKFEAIFVGRLTSDNSRDFYFYFKEAPEVDYILSENLKNFTSYDFYFDDDKNWALYFNVLYPNPKQNQSIINRKVLLNMRKNGDSLQEPREVNHWAYFKSKKDRNTFEKTIRYEKFKIIRKNMDNQENLPYGIVFSRKDKVDFDEIDKYTIELFIIAEKLNGLYDGWETEIVKDKK